MKAEKEGVLLCRLARQAIEQALTGEDPEATLGERPFPEPFRKPSGVFVTLETHPEGHLRGCIGFPEAVYPLWRATVRAAVMAATSDPRFPPVLPQELDKLRIKVSVLTPLEPLEGPPERYPEQIVVGRHGLMVECGGLRGLLLPEVPVEMGWDPEAFLDGTCLKAGLPRRCWEDPDCRVYRFSSRIFAETRPGGEVVEVNLGEGAG